MTDGGSTAGVEPVRLIWRKLLELGGLDDVTEFWDNKLSRPKIIKLTLLTR